VIPKKTKKTERTNRKPFTEEEIQRILHSFKENSFCSCTNYKHSHYHPFIYFIFKTGVRNAETIGLRVQHIDFDKGIIHIKEALARSIKGKQLARSITVSSPLQKRAIC
jgi:integrase